MFQLANVTCQYGQQLVLDVPWFEGKQGEHWLVLGPSGSGKTTLLHVMAGLLSPTSGRVIMAGRDLSELSGNQLDRFRGQAIGIVFQKMHLLSTLTVKNNLLLAQYLAGLQQDEGEVEKVLSDLDVGEKVHAYPHELSQGEKQRVSLARAVINKPKLILADEPTANLDDARSGKVLELMMDQAIGCNATLVIATHDQRVKSRFKNKMVLEESPETSSWQ